MGEGVENGMGDGTAGVGRLFYHAFYIYVRWDLMMMIDGVSKVSFSSLFFPSLKSFHLRTSRIGMIHLRFYLPSFFAFALLSRIQCHKWNQYELNDLRLGDCINADVLILRNPLFFPSAFLFIYLFLHVDLSWK